MDEFLEKFCTSDDGHLWNHSIVSFTSVLSPCDIFFPGITQGFALMCSTLKKSVIILRTDLLNKDT